MKYAQSVSFIKLISSTSSVALESRTKHSIEKRINHRVEHNETVNEIDLSGIVVKMSSVYHLPNAEHVIGQPGNNVCNDQEYADPYGVSSHFAHFV